MQFGKEPTMFVLFRGFRLKKEDFFFPITQNMETNSNNNSQLEGINQVNT